jgi:hypothetical protein
VAPSKKEVRLKLRLRVVVIDVVGTRLSEYGRVLVRIRVRKRRSMFLEAVCNVEMVGLEEV